MAQNSTILACFKQRIAENPALKTLYLAEIEGEKRYYFNIILPKGIDMIYSTIFYDEDCNEANRTMSGGITGRPKGYKPYNTIETVWQREFLKIKQFFDNKQKFKITNLKNQPNQFGIKEEQLIYLSYKSGLQVVRNGKIAKSYKIIPLQTLFYDQYSTVKAATEDLPANALLFKYDEDHFLLTARDKENFILFPSDENGNIIDKTTYFALKLQKK